MADLTGRRFGRWRVVHHDATVARSKPVRWICECDCGTVKSVQAQTLVAGTSLSCGCLNRDVHMTHGKTNTPEFSAWRSMINRCTNPRAKNYRLYGGRGITVCAEWLNSFEAFLAHVGPRPGPHHSLDRVRNEGHYEPGNVRWATDGEQGNNRRTNRLLTHDGKTMTMTQWSRVTGISPHTIHYRIVIAGWPVERALTEPARSYTKKA